MSYSRRRRRRRVRYDRIIGVAAVFIVLLIILVSCCKSCGGKKPNDESSVVPTISSEDRNKENGQNPTGDGGNSEGSSIEPDNTLNEISSYTTESAMPNQMYSGDLILVNKEHEFTFPPTEEEADIVPIYEKASDSYKFQDYEVSLKSKTISALNEWMDAFYAKTGKNDIMIITGYRTKERQDELNNDVRGGYSEFHTGMSLNIGIFPDDGESSSYYEPVDEYEWLDKNCAKYGFILRYPEGKEDETGFEASTSQYRYVGIPHAVYMKDNKLCLEEYIEEVKNYTSEDEHLKISVDEKKYEVYYVPVDPSANTNIPVPEGKKYEVSGNNIDGFIVTVEI